MSDTQVAIAQQLTHQQPSLICPNYEFVQLPPTQGQDHTLLPTPIDITFELPAVTYNLAKSEISCNLRVNNIRTNTDAEALGNYNWIHTSFPSFCGHIQFGDAQNRKIVDIPDLDRYCSTVYSPFTPAVDTLTAGKPRLNLPTNLFGSTITGDNNWSPGLDVAIGDAQSNKSGFEPQHLIRSAQSGGALETGGSAMFLRIRIPLGRLGLHTILNQDKDFYFGRIMYLRLQINPANRVCFASGGVDNPTAALVNNGVVNSPGPRLEAMTLFLAVEKNLAIHNDFQLRYNNGGITYFTDNVTAYNRAFIRNDNGQDSINIKINRYYGKKLKYVIWCPYGQDNLNGNNGVRYVVNPPDGITFITNFYTQIDNQRLQQFNINVEEYQHWLLQKEKLKGSSIFDPVAYTRRQFAWIDDFTGSEPYISKPDADCGLALDQERDYRVILQNANPTVAKTLYVYVVASQTLHVKPEMMAYE